MKFFDIIGTAFTNLLRQKLRTLLTVFSIVIGTTLVSIVYSVIPGVRNFLNTQFNSMNSPRLIEVFPENNRPGIEIINSLGGAPQEYQEGDEGSGFEFEMGSFKNEDIEKIKSIEGVKGVYESPMLTVEYVQLAGGDKRLEAGYVLYYPAFVFESMKIVAGRTLKDSDTGKVFLSNQYVESFGYENPEDLIGKTLYLHVEQMTIPTNMSSSPTASNDVTIQIGQSSVSESTTSEPEEKDFELEIVGISEKTLVSTMIFIPYEDALALANFYKDTDTVHTDEDESRWVAWVEIDNAEDAEEIDALIENLGFRSNTYEDSQDVLDDIFLFLTIAFSSFGVLAITVSSLGIINTLIMAVYERTREIGVMKAVGATKLSVALLFTIEAAFIGLLGGVIGMGLGYGIAEILDIWGHNTVLAAFETLDLSNISTLLLLGPAISTLVATLAGIYPAIRAANLDPVDALRYE